MTHRDACEVRYARQGDTVRVRVLHMTNHELREVLVGFWARLGNADKVDHIRELVHYLEPASRLSPVARAISEGEGRTGAIDLGRYIAGEMKEAEDAPPAEG